MIMLNNKIVLEYMNNNSIIHKWNINRDRKAVGFFENNPENNNDTLKRWYIFMQKKPINEY